jgi:DNA-binding GntR family transcriptional regulator
MARQAAATMTAMKADQAAGGIGLGGGHKTVTAATAEAIRRRILDGSYATGAKLHQDMIAAELGISRIPVREALFQLDAEGLVRIEPQRGATVAPLSRERMIETLELRAMLEPYLLENSAPNLVPADFAELAGILKEYDEAIAAKQMNRWGELNTRFHLGLYARASRPRALAIVTTLLRESDRYTRVQLASRIDYQRRAQAEHAKLLRLCRKGAIEEAATLMRAHILHVSESLERVLPA